MCQCSQLVHRTATRLIMVQLIGAAVGAVTFPLGAWLVRRKFAKEPEDALPAA
jgi:cytochrome oxidase assembly protein ShyY1